MKRVPTESCHIPAGTLRLAEVAWPPSPEEEYSVPSPATVTTRYDGGSADTIIHPQATRARKKKTRIE
jgi:hypothetical protein